MIGLEPRIRFDDFGRRLFLDTELLPLDEPISRVPSIPAGRFTYPVTPFAGSDGPSALDYNPVDGDMKTRYGCPVPGIRADPGLRERVMSISRSAYKSIVRKLGARYGRYFQPDYVAGADVYKPTTISVGRGRIPVGQVKGSFHPGEITTEVIEERNIYGTALNERTINDYEKGTETAERIGGRMGKCLASFCRRMKRSFADKYSAIKTSVHEKYHAGGEKTGLHDEIIGASPNPGLTLGMIEGFACAGANETIGDRPIGQYEGYMKRTYRALKEMGYNSALGFIRDYIDGRVSGRKYALAYARAR